ncbi:MAG: hypothetical protein ACKVS9_00085 [Phycisphaerae bacterium]
MAIGVSHIVAMTALRRGFDAMPKDTDSMLKLGETAGEMTPSWREIVKAIVASPDFFVAVGKAAQLAKDGASEQDIVAQLPQLFTQAAMDKVEATVASQERRLGGSDSGGRKYVPDLAAMQRDRSGNGSASVLSREPATATAGRKYVPDFAAALRAKAARA